MESDDMRKKEWNRPPGPKSVVYRRPEECLSSTGFRPPVLLSPGPFDTVRYLVGGNPLPRIEDAVRIGELTRWALMGRAGALLGKENVPAALSGHATNPEFPHRHAFFLPENEDGRIARVLIHAPMGFDHFCLLALLSLEKIYEREGGEWRMSVESMGDAQAFGGCSSLCAESRTWRSVTPYLHPWHRKRNFSVEDQIRRECRERTWPEIEAMTPLESVEIGGRKRSPVHFCRLRRKKRLTQPDRLGGFWEIRFSEPVRGPVALGFGCHFGLGLFEYAQ